MAYRLLNCCDQALRIDMRGGESLLLEPGAVSPVLREEFLYDNVFVRQWLDQGWVHRLPASLSEAAPAIPTQDDTIDQASNDAPVEASDTAAFTPKKAPRSKSGKGESP